VGKYPLSAAPKEERGGHDAATPQGGKDVVPSQPCDGEHGVRPRRRVPGGKVSGGDLIVAWANEWGYLLEPSEDIRADRARAVLLTPGGSYRCHASPYDV